MYIAVSLVLFIIIGVLLYIAGGLRVEMKYRKVQSRQVCFTIVFSIICVIGFSLLLRVVNAILSIPVIRNGLFNIVPSQNTTASFYFVVALLVNILFLAIYDIFLLLINKLWINNVIGKIYTVDYLESDDSNFIERLFNGISDRFYDGNTLKPLGENVGFWVRGMKKFFGIFLVIESVVLLVLINLKIMIVPENIVSLFSKNLYMIPMASYVILKQVESFLCGDRRIDDGMVDTDDFGESVIGDYSPLIKLYESAFGGNALISYYINNGDVAEKSLYGGVTNAQLKRVNNPELLLAIYRNIENRVDNVSPKYIDSLVELINGKNIAVMDAVCGDFNLYYLAYLQHKLSLRSKVLLICDNKLQVADMVRKYKATFSLINKVGELWRIGDLDYISEKNGNIDVLICTDEQLLNDNLKVRYPEFFEAVSNVSIIDSYAFISRDKAFLVRLFNYIDNNFVQYVINIPENNSDLKTALEGQIKKDIVVFENHNETTNICVMYWKGEAALKTQLVLLPNLVNDFSVAYTIALVASKFEVSDINIQAPADVPIYSYRNTAAGEYALTLAREFFNNDSVSLDGIVKINNAQVFNQKELVFNIVYDENNNLLALTNMWLSYGGRNCSMIHMISRPYMLRDYFANNLSQMCGRLSAIKMFVPINLLNVRSAALAFLIKARKGVLVEEIQQFAHVNGLQETVAERILEKLLVIVLGEKHGYRVYEDFSFDTFRKPKFENDRYIYTHIVRMTNQNLYEILCRITMDNAKVICENQTLGISINKNDIYNHYLPNQCHSFEGVRYKIKRIQKGEIYVTKDETVTEEREYTSVYNISAIDNVSAISSQMDIDNERFTIRMYEADITKTTWGYLEYSNGIDFGNKNNTELKKLVEPIVEKKRSNYLEIVFSYSFKENYEKIAALLVVLVRGLLETLLPKNYKDLMVFSNINKEVVVTETVEGAGTTVKVIDDEKLLYLHPDIQAEGIQENNTNNISLYIVDYATVETGALSAIAGDIDRVLNIIQQYMGWILSNNGGKGSYLCFGLDEIPVMFASKELKDWIDNIALKENTPEKVINGNFAIAASRHCAFCGKPILGSGILLGDGRAMCHNCAEHRTNTKHEVKILLKKAYEFIERKYGVKIPPGIKIKFARREEIEKDAGPHVLGYYMPSKHLIKILRGGPEANVLSTLIHELTHAWQWRVGGVGDLSTMYKEGHSMYVEIECMKETDHREFTTRLEEETERRNDEYGEGFRFWRDYLKEQSDKNIFKHIVNFKGK